MGVIGVLGRGPGVVGRHQVLVVVPLRPHVKVGGVLVVFQLGNEVSLHPQYGIPVHGGKVVVLFDFESGSGSKTVEGLLLQQSLQEKKV